MLEKIYNKKIGKKKIRNEKKIEKIEIKKSQEK